MRNKMNATPKAQHCQHELNTNTNVDKYVNVCQNQNMETKMNMCLFIK